MGQRRRADRCHGIVDIRESVLDIFGQHAMHRLEQWRRAVGTEFPQGLRRLAHVRPHHGREFLLVEGRLARQHLVGDDTQ